MSQIFDTGIVKLAISYKKQFFKNKEMFLMLIGSSLSVRGCLVQLYQILLKKKLCEPIGTLPEAEKTNLYNEAKRISPGSNTKQLIDVVKALHSFGTFLQEDANEILKLVA